MSLLRDVLGVNDSLKLVGIQNVEINKKEMKVKKPPGMSREVFALCGAGLVSKPTGIYTSAISKSEISKKISGWKMRGFYNSARSDNLKLFHWDKIDEEKSSKSGEAGGDGDKNVYPWIQYNIPVKIVRYNDDIYNNFLKDIDISWTKEETDYLFDLCVRFDLRFHVISDRYDVAYKRSVEDIKHRYYTIARKVTEVMFDEKLQHEIQRYNNQPPPNVIAQIKDEKNRHALLRFTYNPELDKERKAMLEKQYAVTEAEKKKEKELSELIKRQELRLKRDEKRRDEARKLKKPFEIHEDLIPDIELVNPLRKSGSSISASCLLEAFKNSYSKKHSEQIDNILRMMNVAYPTVFSQNVVNLYSSLRIDVATMLNLKKKVEKLRKEKEYWEHQLQVSQNSALCRANSPSLPPSSSIPMNLMIPSPPIINNNSVSNITPNTIKNENNTKASFTPNEINNSQATRKQPNSSSKSTKGKRGGMCYPSMPIFNVAGEGDLGENRQPKKHRKSKDKQNVNFT